MFYAMMKITLSLGCLVVYSLQVVHAFHITLIVKDCHILYLSFCRAFGSEWASAQCFFLSHLLFGWSLEIV
jgi:hypothetical protein